MMMKKILLMTFLALGMAVVCRGDAIDPGQLKIFRADGSPGERKALFADGIYTFDGASLLALSWKHPGAQTLRLQVKFAGPPLGALFSKTRPEEGNRGIELGLGGKNFFELDGARPAGQVSDGARANIVPLWDPKAPELQPGIWYDVFLRFTPNDELALYIFDADGQKLLFRKAVPCGKIAGIKAGSGDGLLCIGGRRNSSKSCTSLVPAGTAIRLPEVWTSALAEAQIFALAKVNPDPAAALHNPAPKSYFVAVSGSDANDGLSEKTPFATIRKAADLTRPGDVVTVAPGIYYEQTTFNNAGTAEQPVTFRAAAGGLNSVLITAADRAIREKQKKWKLEDAKLGLYSIECDHQPSRVLYDQIDLFPYPELDQLKTFTLRDGYPGVENGFAFDPGAKRLYVRLHPGNRHGSADPAEHTMSIAPAAAPGYNGHHIHRAEDSIFYIAPKQPMYLVFDGFTFETPGSAAVVTGGSNVVIRNAFFKGCRFGVCGFGSPSGIFIENCTYDQAYAYSDVLDTIRKFRGSDIQKKHFFYFWARKGHNNDTEKVKNYETGIAGGVGAYWHVRNNLIVECFEGMSSWGVNKADHMQIYGNVFRRVVDNAVESENHAADMRIFNNHFHDVFEPVSWQPLDGLPWPGPVFVYRNLFDDGAEFKEIADALDPAQFLPGAFKIGASGRNWQQPHMGSIPTEMIQSRISKRVVSVPEPGFLVFNNTVLRSDGYLVTTPMPISGPAIREIANVKFFNNIFQVKGLNKLAGWDGGLFEFYNNIEVTPDSKLVNRGLMAGIGGKALDAIDGADAAGKKLGTLVFEEPDASVDAGAGELRFAAGPTAKTPVESEFRRKLRYQPSLIRTAGATPDEWGFYMLEGDFQLKLANPGKIGQITLTFRITETETEWLVLKSGRSAFTLNVSKGVTELVLTGPGEPFKIELGRLPRENWQALELDGLKRQIRFNGKEIASLSWWPGEPHAFDIAIGRNPVFDLVIR